MAQVLCILQQYVAHALLPNSTFCIDYQLVASCCSSDDKAYWLLDLGLLLLNSLFLPLDLSYKTMPEILLHLLMIFQGPERIMNALVSSWVLLSSHFQCGTEIDLIFQTAVSCALLGWLLFAESICFPSIIFLHSSGMPIFALLNVLIIIIIIIIISLHYLYNL